VFHSKEPHDCSSFRVFLFACQHLGTPLSLEHMGDQVSSIFA
jgi:hypothetical protein